jgi:hypothetical protein
VVKSVAPETEASQEGKFVLIQKAEWAFLAGVVLLLLACHVKVLTGMGALWRDEVNTIEMASTPTLSGTWKNLEFDSYPMLWFMLLRGWLGLGLTSDFSLRCLGFLVGLGIIGLLWINGRRLKFFPFFSLVLFALHPAIIRYGDSLRGYGMGILLFLLTFRCLGAYVIAPTQRRFWIAAVAAVLSVQAVYQNAVFLFAMGCGGMSVFIFRRDFRSAAAVLIIGMVAALSLVPYVEVIQAGSRWNMVLHLPSFTMGWFKSRFHEALGHGWKPCWWGMFLGTLILGVVKKLFSASSPPGRQTDIARFGFVTFAIGLVGCFVFLKILNYLANPWHYVGLMALMAVAADAVFEVLRDCFCWRIARLLAGIGVIATTFSGSWASLQERFTNIDVIAHEVEGQAAKDDLIVIDGWYYAISFQRYYHGPGLCLTVPPMPIPKNHRMDLAKAQMMKTPEDAVLPVQEKIRETLQAGNTVWLVGSMNFPRRGQKLKPLLPAPQDKDGWWYGTYALAWSSRVDGFVQDHAGEMIERHLPLKQPVAWTEYLALISVRGWKEESHPVLH